MLKLLAVCLTLAAFSHNAVYGRSFGLQDLLKRFQERRGVRCLSSETEDLSRRWAVFNGRRMETTVAPKNAKVGDTVMMKCVYFAPKDYYAIKILKKNGWDVEEVGRNAQIKSTFGWTGRYKSTVDINYQGDEQETVVTLTISDVQIEDSGEWGCEVPVGAPSYGASTRDFGQLNVTKYM